MKRKCICKNVNSPCSIGCTNMTSFKQLISIMEYMAISKPLNTSVPKPNTETVNRKSIIILLIKKKN